MNLREKNYEIEMSYDDIKPFEEKMLFSGLCDFILPMYFSDYEGKRKITYDCSGYVSIRDLKPNNPKEVFEILEKTLLTINKSVEFFIPYEKITLNIDTVYYNPKQKNIKVAYIPAKEGTFHSHMADFIKELSDYATNDTVEYLTCVKEDMIYNNKNIKDMVSFVNEQRKIIYQCGVK